METTIKFFKFKGGKVYAAFAPEYEIAVVDKTPLRAAFRLLGAINHLIQEKPLPTINLNE